MAMRTHPAGIVDAQVARTLSGHGERGKGGGEDGEDGG